MRGATLLLVLGLVACAAPGSPGDGTGDGASPGPTGSAPSATRILTVPEAIKAGDQSVKVRGYVLIAADGQVRICTGLAGSYPPQCGSPSLLVAGLQPERIPGMQSAGGVEWSGETTLRGTLADGILTIA